ncbi:unnamed protein product [Nesidiocoris tenuis]|uniref:Uncharacterized protein n=1 Tax=Nesidiocoris tenuis TaxID=355587 RepID=A0A6H5G2T5_9HEMI|nr:unnamed protein product [Nesidiocoris tenuis]
MRLSLSFIASLTPSSIISLSFCFIEFYFEFDYEFEFLFHSRHKPYKKDKRVKVAMTVILLIIYFIINQLFYMFDKVARTAIFAKLVIALKIFVVVKLLELKRYLWWVKEEKKEGEYHSELSLHDHHYDDHDHHYDSYGPPDHHGPPHWHAGWYSRNDPQTQAYHAQIPGPMAPALPPYPPYNPDKTIKKRR